MNLLCVYVKTDWIDSLYRSAAGQISPEQSVESEIIRISVLQTLLEFLSLLGLISQPFCRTMKCKAVGAIVT